MIHHDWGGLGKQFWQNRPLIGMVHLKALPGSVLNSGMNLDEIIRFAIEDATALQEGGASAVMVENFFDVPFAATKVPVHTIAAMSITIAEIRKAVSIPIGVNVLRNDSIAALAIAYLCKAQFIRVNVFVGAAVTDQGIIEGSAREVALMRKQLNADVAIWADIFVKHAAQLGNANIEDASRDAVHRGLADALIVSGAATGAETSLHDLEKVRKAVPDTPILVGSGFHSESASPLLQYADGAIVGTSLKIGGIVENSVDSERVKLLRNAMDTHVKI